MEILLGEHVTHSCLPIHEAMAFMPSALLREAHALEQSVEHSFHRPRRAAYQQTEWVLHTLRATTQAKERALEQLRRELVALRNDTQTALRAKAILCCHWHHERGKLDAAVQRLACGLHSLTQLWQRRNDADEDSTWLLFDMLPQRREDNQPRASQQQQEHDHKHTAFTGEVLHDSRTHAPHVRSCSNDTTARRRGGGCWEDAACAAATTHMDFRTSDARLELDEEKHVQMGNGAESRRAAAMMTRRRVIHRDLDELREVLQRTQRALEAAVVVDAAPRGDEAEKEPNINVTGAEERVRAHDNDDDDDEEEEEEENENRGAPPSPPPVMLV